jgi:DNA ligase (NAD+)
VEASKARPWSRLLYGLGIRHVGDVTAQAIADVAPSLEDLLDADEERLAEADGVGPVVAASVMDHLSSEANRGTLLRLRDAGLTVRQEAPARPAEGPLSGMAVVVTGTIEGYTRDEARAAVTAAGGRATDSVSKRTSLVVAGPGAGSKLERATALGVPVVDAEGFRAILSGASPPPAPAAG